MTLGCGQTSHSHCAQGVGQLVLPFDGVAPAQVVFPDLGGGPAACKIGVPAKRQFGGDVPNASFDAVKRLRMLDDAAAAAAAAPLYCNTKCHPSKPISMSMLSTHDVYANANLRIFSTSPLGPVQSGPALSTSSYKVSHQVVTFLEGLIGTKFSMLQVGSSLDGSSLGSMGGGGAVTAFGAGHTILLHTPFKAVMRTLQNYIQCKNMSPTDTAAGILVPYRPTAPYWGLLKSWKCMHVFQPGFTLYEKGLHKPKALKGPMAFFYDAPVVPPVQNAVLDAAMPGSPPDGHGVCTFASKRHTFSFKGAVQGQAMQVLIDTGASGTAFVSKWFCEAMQIPCTPAPAAVPVKLGDNSEHLADLLATVTLRIQSLKLRLQCLVLPDIPGHQVILGDTWLSQHHAVLDYDSATVTVRKSVGDARVFTLVAKHNTTNVARSVEMQDEMSVQQCTLSSYKPRRVPSPMTTLQLKQAVRKQKVADAFLFFLSPETTTELPASVTGSKDSDVFHAAVPGTSPSELRMRAMLMSYQHVFKSELPAGLPPARTVRQVIPLQENVSIPNRPMFRYSPAEHAEMQRQVTELLQRGVLEVSSSPFGAPILFVKKKGGDLRMCVDYRALNKITIRNQYPLPRVDDLLDKLHGSTVFSSLDLTSGYHQIRLSPEDVAKTAFKTPFGLFQYKVMPFGLTNAPSVFMAAMHEMLQDLPFCVVYLDDILVFSKTPEEHVAHVEAVLARLEANKYYAKLSKCDFFKSEVKFLGHVVTAEGVKPDPKKVEVVQNWPRPVTVSDVRSFLGLANYFRKYIQDYSKIAGPLTNLTKGNISRNKGRSMSVPWTDRCQESFDKLK